MQPVDSSLDGSLNRGGRALDNVEFTLLCLFSISLPVFRGAEEHLLGHVLGVVARTQCMDAQLGHAVDPLGQPVRSDARGAVHRRAGKLALSAPVERTRRHHWLRLARLDAGAFAADDTADHDIVRLPHRRDTGRGGTRLLGTVRYRSETGLAAAELGRPCQSFGIIWHGHRQPGSRAGLQQSGSHRGRAAGCGKRYRGSAH